MGKIPYGEGLGIVDAKMSPKPLSTGSHKDSTS
jgi:hypothetical protein